MFEPFIHFLRVYLFISLFKFIKSLLIYSKHKLKLDSYFDIEISRYFLLSDR